MIPLRLSVKNFLCYRENVPALDFTGLHVACLCGQNGHGKSALLDAITWALWGKARGKTHDDLISYGADECRVELEFLARDTRYRVIRSHARGRGRRRQGVTDLQLQVLGDGDARPITGNSVRESQARIEQLLGMDYDTFINSAFLLQGRADEFSNKTPAERKEVLAKILGLDGYDRLQTRTKERLEESQKAAANVEGALSQMRREAESIGGPSVELAGVGKRLEELTQQLAWQRQKIDGLRGRINDLERQRREVAELDKQVRSRSQDISDLRKELADTQSHIKEYRDLIQQTATIQQGVEALEQARRRFEALEQTRRRFDALNEKRNRLSRDIATKQGSLEEEIRQLRRKVEVELTPKAQAGVTLAAQLEDTGRRLDQLAAEGLEVAGQRQHQQTLATRIGEAQSTAERYKVEGQEVRKKLDLLNSSYTSPPTPSPSPMERGLGGEAVLCPLCQTPLGEDGCRRLAETYQAEIEEKRRLYRENQSHLQQLETAMAALERDLPRREKTLERARREVQSNLNKLEYQLQESQQAKSELEQVGIQLAAATRSLESGNFAAEEQAQRQEVERQLQALGYDEKVRQESYNQMRKLQPFEEKQRQLSDAVAQLPREEESLARSQDMLQRRQAELVDLQERHQVGEEAIAGLPQQQASLREAGLALAELERGQQRAIERRGYLEGQLRRLEELQREIATDSAALAGLQEDQAIYRELVDAFGRKGVQALLIETVLPRLEEEANALLGRMTDNRMHLKLETQQERRSGRGEPIETLEINVSDELGPRSYEMYSGGEAFRVNLALRIALSRVLSQRMGAPLPTLFIDEGFGTQDTAGRERILDVISAIQDDFDKIIVITHLDELKDMFPVRIEVQKDGNGSTFWLS